MFWPFFFSFKVVSRIIPQPIYFIHGNKVKSTYDANKHDFKYDPREEAVHFTNGNGEVWKVQKENEMKEYVLRELGTSPQSLGEIAMKLLNAPIQPSRENQNSQSRNNFPHGGRAPDQPQGQQISH